MPGAGHEPEQLRGAVQEIHDLRDEEQKHGLAEVSQDSHGGERHAGKVGECVTHEYSSRIPGAKFKDAMLFNQYY